MTDRLDGPAPTTVPTVMTLPTALSAGRSRDAVHRDVRAGRLRRPYRGVYVVGGDDSPEATLLAARAHLGPEAVAVLRSAAVLHGLAGTPLLHVPQFALPPGMEKRQREGLDLHFWELADDDVTDIGPYRATTIARTLADICRLLPRLQAVACIDSALHLGAIEPTQFDAVRRMMSRRRRCVTGRRVLDEARPGAQSPLETRVRLRASDAGYVPDALQVPIHAVSGALLGYGDIGYALPGGGWLIVEADGVSVHSLPDAVLHDRRRQNAFLSVPGVTMLRFTWADTRVSGLIPATLGPILHRHGWRPGRWTP